jgi:hypothetical protein
VGSIPTPGTDSWSTRSDVTRNRYRNVIVHVSTALTLLASGAFLVGRQGPVPSTGHISGRTLTPDESPLANVDVLLACPPRPVQRSRSDASGRFEFRSPEANCRVIARKEGYVEAAFNGDLVPGGYGIAVRAGSAHDGIELRLAPAGSITGMITAASGELPRGLRFQVVRRERVVVNGMERLVPLSYALVRPDGRFDVPGLLPGDYFVVAYPAPYGSQGTIGGFAVTYFPGTSRLSDATAIEVKAGDRLEANFQLVAAPTFSMSGVVYDAAGLPVSDAAVGVSVAAPPNWSRGSARTGRDGRFVIGGLQDGRYLARASRTNAAGRLEIGEILLDVNGADVPSLTVRMSAQ